MVVGSSSLSCRSLSDDVSFMVCQQLLTVVSLTVELQVQCPDDEDGNGFYHSVLQFEFLDTLKCSLVVMCSIVIFNESLVYTHRRGGHVWSVLFSSTRRC